MKCSKCGREVQEGWEFCNFCGERVDRTKVKENEKGTMENVNNKSKIIKVGIFIVAAIVVLMFFYGSNAITEAASRMEVLRSVGGETVAEAYYQYYGRFLSGLAIAVRALGITCGIVIAYVGDKINR